MKESASLVDGRAFVNGIRTVDGDRLLKTGDIVEVWAARATAQLEEGFEVLAFTGDLLVAQKPASLTTTADHRGSHSLVSKVEAFLEVNAPHFLGAAHPVSRLDVGVSGVVLFALSPEARRTIERATEEGRLFKRYVAIARGRLVGEGLIEGAVGRDARGTLRRPALSTEGKPSVSRFKVLAAAKDATLVELVPVTGRTHQLRLHAASAGAPLFGDRAHGGPTRITSKTGAVRDLGRIMLHAISVELDIEGHLPLFVASTVPKAMVELWSTLDGDPNAWNAPGSTRESPPGS